MIIYSMFFYLKIWDFIHIYICDQPIVFYTSVSVELKSNFIWEAPYLKK